MIHRENEILISYPEAYNDDYCSMCVTDHMQGLVKHAIKFLVQCHHELQKKNCPKKYAPNNYYSKGQSIKHVLSKTSDFRPDTLLNYLSTCYSWTLITKNMIVFSLWRQNSLDFCYRWFMLILLKYDHNGPQSRPHENELELFSNKLNVTNSCNRKGKWKIRVWFSYFLRYGPYNAKNSFFCNFVLTSE